MVDLATDTDFNSANYDRMATRGGNFNTINTCGPSSEHFNLSALFVLNPKRVYETASAFACM